MLRTTSLAAALTVAALAQASAAEFKVDQVDLRFAPDALTIKAGDYVRFTDSDRITHNITIVNPDGTIEDKGMSTFSQHIVVQFDKAGVYRVICRIHPDMKMTITVTK
ncbi:MAG: cupredoxin domain-containing protein [Alphaproteobacteria bacterium]|nr:cupredoxin domain-containing protein [Alphaproteobacteria bacterium]MBV9694640.1 cupredoxin domain-containing protein [Alphaproteobacteria bacterium]